MEEAGREKRKGGGGEGEEGASSAWGGHVADSYSLVNGEVLRVFVTGGDIRSI
jgi:hypothetical protein